LQTAAKWRAVSAVQFSQVSPTSEQIWGILSLLSGFM
jgi:hypothetical protein